MADPQSLSRNPFAPARLRVHPLTKAVRDGGGVTLLICHVEFQDSWGDSCKSGGRLTVELFRPTGARVGGPGVLETTWAVDLSNLDLNGRLYDPATRTYRLQLDNAPAWVLEMPEGRSRFRVRVILTLPADEGRERFLEDEYSTE